mgnify:CR=1 FL=1
MDGPRVIPGDDTGMFRSELVRAFAAVLLLCLVYPAHAQTTELPEPVSKVLTRYKLPPGSFSAFVQKVGAASPLLTLSLIHI